MARYRSKARRSLGLLAAGLVGVAAATMTTTDPDALVDTKSRGAVAHSGAVAFIDATRAAGLSAPPSPTWGATWADHDRDGWPDLLVVRHKRMSRLFRGEGGSYVGTDRDWLPPPADRWYYDRHACAWGEANGDGRPDLYCVSGAQKGEGTGPNQLVLGGRSEVAARLGLQDLAGRGRSLNWIDLDGDGDLDLFVGNQVRAGQPNRTFRNDAGHFSEVDVGLTESRATTTSAWSDWDRDGDPDLVVLGQGLRGSSAYENRSGRFVEVAMEGLTGQTWRAATWGDMDGDGYSDLVLVDDNRLAILANRDGRMTTSVVRGLRAGRAAAWLDVDNEGDLDLFVVQGRPLGGGGNMSDLLFLNEGGRFRKVAAGVGGSRNGDGDAVVAADGDRDGRVDLFVTNGSGESHRGRWVLWRNITLGGNWVALRLDGGRWNPFGFGARVRVTTMTSTRWFEITDAAASKVQSDPGYLHVGLGDEKRAVVSVWWPDGSRDCLRLSARRVVSVVAGSSPCSTPDAVDQGTRSVGV